MLPDDYYLNNFNDLVDFVESTYRELLSVEELDWLYGLRGTSKPAQQLYIRLLGRKASLFRLSRLSYAEIDSISEAASELVEVGLCAGDPNDRVADILRSFTKPELIKRLDLSQFASLPRAELTEKILSRGEKQLTQDIQTLANSEQWLIVFGHQHFTLFQLCFFGNLYQDNSEFVRRDLGTLRYETYVIDEYSRPFLSRAQLDAHLLYYECDALYSLIALDDPDALIDLSGRLPDRWPNDHHLDRRIDRLRNRIARQLERLGKPDEALNLYAQSTNPPAREREVRLHYQLGNVAVARKLLSQIIQEPSGEAELQFAHQFSTKIDGSTRKRERPFKPHTTKLALTESKERVEIATQHYFSQFGVCYFVENSLIDGVLGLFIWDIIFANVPGAFFNPFQSAPSDFYHRDFVNKRQTLIDERMTALNDPLKFGGIVRDNYRVCHGLANPLVRWHRLSEELLAKALLRIPTSHWRSIFTRLLEDLRENSSGLPDLILFPEEGSYELIEIKGPGDTIQKNQRRWMRYFSEHHIPSRVVNVRWIRSTEDSLKNTKTRVTPKALVDKNEPNLNE